MEQKQTVPSFKLRIYGELGLDNFNLQFTEKPVQLTPDDSDIVRKTDGYKSIVFEYISHLLIYEDECV